jgi:excisionase family DNA binding protein
MTALFHAVLLMTSARTSPEPDTLPARPTIQEAAAFLQVTDRTVRNRLADGTLIGYRIGPRAVRIDRDSLLALASRPL